MTNIKISSLKTFTEMKILIHLFNFIYPKPAPSMIETKLLFPRCHYLKSLKIHIKIY